MIWDQMKGSKGKGLKVGAANEISRVGPVSNLSRWNLL